MEVEDTIIVTYENVYNYKNSGLLLSILFILLIIIYIFSVILKEN